MKYWSLAALVLIACSGSSENADLSGAPRGTTDPSSTNEPTEPSTGDTDAGHSGPADAGTTPSDAGTKPADAGTDAKAIDPSPFAGAPAYTATLGPSARKGAHPFPNDNPAGRPCFNCHGDTGSGTPMAFGGTVYANAAGTTPAARVEVRVKDEDGKAISAWSDADGNFYFLVNPNGDLAFPAHAGIRDAKGTKVMPKTISNGNCNGCHNAAGAGRLVAP